MARMQREPCVSPIQVLGPVWLAVAVLLCVVTPSLQTLHQFRDHNQAEFIRSLKSYHITHPSLVSHNGDFLSHDLHPNQLRRRRSTDKVHTSAAIHYKISLPDKDDDIVLRIFPNSRLISPGIPVERWRNVYGNLSDVRVHSIGREKVDCFYKGTISRYTRSKVALSVCQGLRGFLNTDGEDYFIEPVKGHNSSQDSRQPHVIYKRSAIPGHLSGVKKRNVDIKSTCGVTDADDGSTERSLDEGRQADSAHKRRRRSVSTERFVETLVVVDPTMVQYYKDDDIENYVLTIMNMVSMVFEDASIGNAINIIVVRLLLLEKDRDDLKITHHADNTLASFCHWQKMVNPKGDDHASHHDTAILITRVNICSRMNQPCSTLGLAQVSGMCQQHRSCSINEDTGLALAYTITHELGHNFGMKHDGVHNYCKSSSHFQHVMSSHLIADSSPLVWSNCSRAALTNFLDRDWGYCLNDEPTVKAFQYPVQPAGTMYDADHQCRLIYGPEAKLCSGIENICSTLWCRVNNKCLTKLEAATEGTLCGENKWCFAGDCTLIGERPEAIDGEWGVWSEWYPCTRTCGAGVSLQTRHCNNPRPAHGGKYCLGERKRYRICNTMECDASKPNFRQVQCSAFNNKLFKKKQYMWEPVPSSVYPCQLHCKPVDKYFSVMARDNAMDGTPCRHGSKDMCISGRCRHVGCDWQIDSKATEDRCGVCHGDSTACKMVKQKFSKRNGHGYVEATVIPVGARNIRVEEVAAANNYLALRNDQGHYYLNGNWFIQWSGDYDVAGTTVRYMRSGNKESFVAAGPLKEQLHLMLLFQTDNPGVSFEYTVPTENGTQQRKPVFKWVYTDWSHCSASCGAGTQRSEVVCVENESGLVDDRYCDYKTKLDDRQRACNTHECPARWWIGPWQHCSVTCGSDGFHHRTVICVRGIGIGEQIALDEAACHGLHMPRQVKACRAKVACPRRGAWIAGDWQQPCTKNLCMVQWRSVTCSDHSSGCDLHNQPSSVRRCSAVTCGQWKISIWSPCSKSCGSGIQYRNVFCDHPPCNPDKEPATQQSCNADVCPKTTTTSTTTTTTTTTTKPPTTSKLRLKSTSQTERVANHTPASNSKNNVEFNVSVETGRERIDLNEYNGVISGKSDKATPSETKQNLSSVYDDITLNTFEGKTGGRGGKTHDGEVNIGEKTSAVVGGSTRQYVHRGYFNSNNVINLHNKPRHTVLLTEVNERNKSLDSFINTVRLKTTKAPFSSIFFNKLHQSNADSNRKSNVDFKVIKNSDDANFTVPLSEDNSTQNLPINLPKASVVELTALNVEENSLSKPDDASIAKEGTSKNDFYIPSVRDVNTSASDRSRSKAASTDPNLSESQNLSRNDLNNEIPPYISEGGSEIYDKARAPASRAGAEEKLLQRDENVAIKVSKAEHAVELISDAYDGGKGSNSDIHIDSYRKYRTGDDSVINVSINTNNSSINEYVNSHKNEGTEKSTATKSGYTWLPLPWEKCSGTCGNSTRGRAVVCVNAGTQTRADDDNCAHVQTPVTEEPCTSNCRQWIVMEWTRCSPLCGPASRRRHVYCPQTNMCDSHNKPHPEEACNVTQPCVTWIAGEWSMCSKTCGAGIQRRMVQCVNLLSQQSTTECGTANRPHTRQSCNTDKCAADKAALSQKCEYNKMGYKICEVLMNMKQCTKPFVQRNCCKSCGIEHFNMYRPVGQQKKRKHKTRGRDMKQ